MAINRMKKAKAIDEMIPFLALLTKASSVGIHGQIPLVCAKIFKPYGAVFSHLFVKPSKDLNAGSLTDRVGSPRLILL